MRKKIDTFESSLLLPANIPDIMEKYGHLLCSYDELRDRDSIYANFKQTRSKLSILFPLIEHPVHGKTGLHATEKYDNYGYIREYHYQWKRIVPKSGIRFSHISAWENEPHDDPNTPEEYKVNSEPHHHHHVPGNRKKRQDNFDTRTLKAAFEKVAYYISTGKEYKP